MKTTTHSLAVLLILSHLTRLGYSSSEDLVLRNSHKSAYQDFNHGLQFINNNVLGMQGRKILCDMIKFNIKTNKFDMAINQIDEFLIRYPFDNKKPYMHLIKGISYIRIMKNINKIDVPKILKALNEFYIIQRHYKLSKYYKQAQQLISLLINRKAEKEMEIGYFYLKSYYLIAAINRFKIVIEKYPRSPFMPESIYKISSIYNMLGMKDLGFKYRLILTQHGNQ